MKIKDLIDLLNDNTDPEQRIRFRTPEGIDYRIVDFIEDNGKIYLISE